MSPTIPSKDIVVALHQLHPFLSKHVLPLIFNYQQKHIFILNKTLFVQALTIALHLSSGGLCGMVYEHLSRRFIPKDPSLRFSKKI
jgi:hypothetical protein